MLKLYAMCCGRLRFDRTLFFPGEAPGEQMTIEVPSFLIRHDRGVVLFDTGVDCFAHQDSIARLGKRIDVGAEKDDEPPLVILAVGQQFSDAVQGVLLARIFVPVGEDHQRDFLAVAQFNLIRLGDGVADGVEKRRARAGNVILPTQLHE